MTADEGPARAPYGALRVLQVTLLLSALAFVPAPRFSLNRVALAKELVLHIGVFAAAALCLVRARRIRLDVTDLALAAALVLTALSAVLAADNGWLALRAAAISTSAIVAFWTARALTAQGQGDGLLAASGGALVLAALPAVLATYGLAPDLSDINRAPAGTFGNRNFLAHLLAIGLPALALVATRARGGWRRAAWSAGLVVVSAACVFTRSRAAWLALAAALGLAAVTLLWRGRAPRPAMGRPWAPLAALLAGAALAVSLPNRLDWRAASPYLDTVRRMAEHDEGSGRGRLIQYRRTLAMAGEHALLGVGPGNWMVHYPRYADRDDPSYAAGNAVPTNRLANSDWIGGLAERGLPALLALVIAGGALAWGAWRRGALALLATLAAVFVVGALDAVLQRATPALLAAVVIGALAAPARTRLTACLGTGARVAAAGLALGLGAVFAVPVVRSIAAGAIYSTDRSAAALERAARTAPGEYRLQYLAAQYWTGTGDCTRAEPYLRAARRQLPHAKAPAWLEQRCAAPAQQHPTDRW